MPITSCTIENFKGIRDKVKIDLKPITLLFGPNSAGKSTIIQALHYAWEVIGRHNLDPNFTEFGGREMDLGGFKNLVYGQDPNRSISIRLDMDMKGKILSKYGDSEKRAFDDIVFDGGTESVYDGNINISYWHCKKEILNGYIEVQVSWCSSKKNFYVLSYEVGLNGERIAKIKTTPEGDKVNIVYINFFHPLLVSINTNLETILKENKKSRLFDLLKIIIWQIGPYPEIWMDQNLFTPDQNKIFRKIGKKIQKKSGNSIIKNSDLYAPYLPYEFLFICFEAFDIESINEDLKIECSGLSDALPTWEIPFHLRFKSEESDYYAEALEAAIMQLIHSPGQLIKDELKKLRYLGPIRSRIPRNYVPNRFVDWRNWPDGLAAWDVLHKNEDEEIVKQTDFWMEDRLKSGYHITRKTYKEIDASQIAPEQDNILALYNSAPVKTRLYLLDQKSGVEVQPPDVGVGISQVIPVIVSALYFKDGIVSIEQPELHIHPALQVTLGDLFISQIQEKGPYFLLETHSEHLMLRFLRRIRETSEGNLSADNSALTPDQLAIYYIEPGENGMTVSQIRVDQDGEFMDRWPRGFFAERAKELL